MTKNDFLQARHDLLPSGNVDEFAELIGLSRSQAYRIIKGDQDIGAQTELIINLLKSIKGTKTGKQFGV